jgi:hypothetical protein
MVGASCVQASEIFGTISTDPGQLYPVASSTPAVGQPQNSSNNGSIMPKASGGSGLIIQKPDQEDAASKKNKNSDKAGESADKDNVKVLGISYYPDNSLLRGSGHHIYIIKGKLKKLIRNLKELQNYRGQPIYEMTDEELSTYQTKTYLDGDLIREKGREKVYVIKNGIKKLILNLNELRLYYSGLRIYDISPEIME